MSLLRLCLFLLLSMTAFSQTFTTRGTEFWTGFMENSGNRGHQTLFAFFISSPRATTGEILIPGMGYRFPFSVEANRSTRILLPEGVLNAAGSERVERKGIMISANDPVEVYAFQNRIYYSDASIVLPVGQLGSSYTGIASESRRVWDSLASSLMIVASENDTRIEIIPSAMTQGLHPAGVPFTITLDQGDIYQILPAHFRNLSGTSVRSTNGKRFAFYGGARAAAVVCEADSHVYDQLLPLEQWGGEYLLVPFSGRIDRLRIVASEDSTDVHFDCAEVIRLDKGDSYIRDFSAPVRITATRPIGISQLARGFLCAASSGGGTETDGDPTMLVLTPLSQRVRAASFHSPASLFPIVDSTYTTWKRHFVTLILPASDTAGLRLDGRAVASQLAPHPSDARYLQGSIQVSAGDHLLEAPNGVVAYAYGFGDADGYSFSLGADTLKFDAAGRIDFTYAAGVHSLPIAACDTVGSLKLCAGGAFTFRADADASGEQWEWDFGDGTTGNGQQVVHSFDSAGEYDVTLTSSGPACTFQQRRKRVIVGECSRQAASELTISPNPTKRSLSITSMVRRRSLVTLELLGFNGELLGILSQQMLDPGLHATTVDMGDRPSGLYYLRGSFGDEVIIRKIVRTE